MTKYFGTDGIRGKANITLTAETAFKIGRYIGYYYNQKSEKKCSIVVGKDTRISSDMLENAIAAGASSSGADVYLVSYCPTPCIAYLTKNNDFVCGVMISASHNPYYDNGIKIFSHNGLKLSSDIEEEIERYIDDEINIDFASGDKIGRIYDYSEGLDQYLDNLRKIVDFDLSHFKIAIDCANGSASTTAEKFFNHYGCEINVINNVPDGLNINTDCGSTHIHALQDVIKQGNYDIGLAFDGDADRLIAINHDGEIVDGDHVLYICGKYLKSLGHLRNNTVVTTVMANLGLFKALETLDINTDVTAVGDKYVCESMLKNDFIIGGEQSGHIIFKDHATTGDGLLTAIMILQVMSKTKMSLKELSDGLKIYPQLLVNVKVKDKQVILNHPDVLSEIEKVNNDLAGNGRILVRGSGTEMLVRVMVEAETDELCNHYVYRVVDLINSLESK